MPMKPFDGSLDAPSLKPFSGQLDQAGGEQPQGVSAGDYLRAGVGSATQAVGGLVRGAAEAVRLAPTAKSLKPVSDAVARAGDWLSDKGGEVSGGMSQAAQRAVAGSTPEGSLADPSSWSLGTDPSVAGYALQATQGLGSIVPTVAAGIASRGRLAPTAAAAAGTGGGFAAQGEQQRIEDMDDAAIAALPAYQQLLRDGVTPQAARAQLAAASASSAFRYTAPISAADALLEVVPFTGVAQKAIGRMVGTSRLRRAAAGAAGGAAGEAAQEVAEGAASIAGANAATGEERDLLEGSLANATLGAMIGGPIGGLAGAVTPPDQVGANVNTPKASDALAEGTRDEVRPVPVEVQQTVVNPADGPLSRAVATDAAEQTGSPVVEPVVVTTTLADEQQLGEQRKAAEKAAKGEKPAAAPAQTPAPSPEPIQAESTGNPSGIPIAVPEGIDPESGEDARTPEQKRAQIEAELQGRTAGIIDSASVTAIANKLMVPRSDVSRIRGEMRAMERTTAANAAQPPEDSTNGTTDIRQETLPFDESGSGRPGGTGDELPADQRAGAPGVREEARGQEGGEEGNQEGREEGAGQEGGKEGSQEAGREAGQRQADVPNLTYDESTEQLDGDITTPSGAPFSIRDAADRAAKRHPGGRVVELEDGGFVIRTPTESANVPVPQSPPAGAKDAASAAAVPATAATGTDAEPAPVDAPARAADEAEPAAGQGSAAAPALANDGSPAARTAALNKGVPADILAAAETARARSDAASEVMQKFPKGAMGLTPDDVKRTPEFKAAKAEMDAAQSAERKANAAVVKARKAVKKESPNATQTIPASPAAGAAGAETGGRSTPASRRAAREPAGTVEAPAAAEGAAGPIAGDGPAPDTRAEDQSGVAGSGVADEHGLVAVKDVYGKTVRVKKSDLDSSRTMLPMYRKDGTRLTGRGGRNESIVRDNIDNGSNRVTMDLPYFAAKDGNKERPFKSVPAARRAVRDAGQSLDDYEIQRSGEGFIAVRKAKAGAPAAADAEQAAESAAPAAQPRASAPATAPADRSTSGEGNSEPSSSAPVAGSGASSAPVDEQRAKKITAKAAEVVAAIEGLNAKTDGGFREFTVAEVETLIGERGIAAADRFLKAVKDGAKQQEKLDALMKRKGEKASTAPEHSSGSDDDLAGVSPAELNQMVKAFAEAGPEASDPNVTNIFAPPTKAEVVRLQDKVKVYHKDHGWMTVADAKALIATWEDRAVQQGKDSIAGRNTNSDKIVLSLFDLTGSWSMPWEQAGYQVFRFDIQDGSTYEDPNTGEERKVGDINNMSVEFFSDLFGDFDGKDVYAILAACPCTDFAVSGARHFAAKDADGRTVKSIRLVKQTLAAIEYFKPAVWAVENPVGRIEKLGGLPPWRLSFDPNHLGDPYTKKTLLWGRFNGDLPIAPVDPVEGSKMHRLYGGKSLATKNARSETPEGFSYGFFMANNAIDNPEIAAAWKYDRLDRSKVRAAVERGITGEQLSAALDEHYFMELDDEAGNAVLDYLAANGWPEAGNDFTFWEEFAGGNMPPPPSSPSPPPTPAPEPETTPAPVTESPASPVATKDTPQPNNDTMLGITRQLLDRMTAGEADADELRGVYARVRAERAQAIAEIGKMKKADIAQQFNVRDDDKASMVQAAYRMLLQTFTLGKSISYMMVGGDPTVQYMAAVDGIVAGLTQADIDAYAEGRRERRERVQAAKDGMADPKTLDDFTRLSRSLGGEKLLSPAQRAEFDRLRADYTLMLRARDDGPKTARAVDIGSTEMKLIETTHTKKGHQLFVVQIGERVDRDVYDRLNSGAKTLGGHYSSYRGGGAVPGFQFPTREAADKFMALREGDQEGADRSAERQANRAETLGEKATALREKANDSLSRDRRANTARQAGMAASAEARANAELAMANTMDRIAVAQVAGDTRMLGRVQHRTQIELLESALTGAAWEHQRAAGVSWEKAKEAPITAEMLVNAELPKFNVTRSDMVPIVGRLLQVRGGKQIGESLKKMLDLTDEYQRAVSADPMKFALSRSDGKLALFRTKANAEAALANTAEKRTEGMHPLPRTAIVKIEFQDTASGRALKEAADGPWLVALSPEAAIERKAWLPDYDKKVGISHEAGEKIVSLLGVGANSPVPYWFESYLDRRKKMAALGIERDFMLREALREYLSMRSAPAQESELLKMERALVGRKDVGIDFFPTPPALVQRMVEQADIGPGMRVLEPSAGKGDIAEELATAAADVHVDTVEIAPLLRDILQAKGFNTVADEFLAFNPSTDSQYDRIVMNPPFGNGADGDHIKHAYSMLKPGGRIVAIAGEGIFSRSDRKAQDFRQWLERVGGVSEQLPEGSFKSSFRPTGVNTRLVIIEKPSAGARSVPEPGRERQPLETEFLVGVNDLDRAVRKITGQWTGDIPTVRAIESADQLPDFAKRESGWESAEGWYDGRGTIYLIANNLANLTRAQQVLAHEAFGHYGVEGVMGTADWTRLVGQVAKLRKDPSSLSAELKAALASTERRYADANPGTFARELIAVMAERGVRGSFMTRVLAALRRWLKAMNFPFDSWQDAELRDIVARGVRQVAERAQQRTGAMRGPAQGRAFHGSASRDIGRFTLDKVFSGEGRTAFGWGVYFASKQEIADFYRRNQTGTARNIPATMADDAMQRANGDRAQAIRDLMRRRDALPEAARGQTQAAIDWLRRDQNRGQVYEVAIPDDDQLLDWNRPVDDLPQAMQEKLAAIMASDFMDPVTREEWEAKKTPEARSGGAFYNTLSMSFNNPYAEGGEGASRILAENGIPGLRYLDGDSRTGGNGTHNYVIWDEATIGEPRGLFSMPDSQKFDAIMGSIKGTDSVWQRLKDKTEDVRPALLAALTTRQLVEISAPYLPSAEGYQELADRMAARRNVLQAEVGDLAMKWQDMQKASMRKATAAQRAARDTDSDRAVDLMHDATIAGTDPAEAYEVSTVTLTSNGETVPLDEMSARAAIGRLEDKLADKEWRRNAPDATARTMEADIRRIEAGMVTEAERRAEYPKLQRRFNALPKEWQDLYREVRDAYANRAEQMLDALLARIEGLEIDEREKEALKNRMRANFESARVHAPYFPLARFGDYWVSFEKPGENGAEPERQFVMAETKRERDRAIKAAEAAGYKVAKKGRKIENVRAQDGASGAFMSGVNDVLSTAGVGESVRDEIYQLYLRTLPDLSTRKNFIHRKKVAGYDQDALRAFAGNMFHGAHQLARLEYQPRMQDQLDKIVADAKAAQDSAAPEADKASVGASEFKKRHEWILNPTNAEWVQSLSAINFIYYLGVSPAAALVNLSQTAITSFPALASKYGWMKALNVIMGTMRDSAKNVRVGDSTGIRRSLKNEGERAAYEQLQLMGAIDVTQAHDLAGLGESDTRGYSATAHKVMNAVSFLFHKAEVVNREATAIAAYRLAREAGKTHDVAVKEAADTIWQTHFDYSSANRARFMQGNAAKVLFAFKQYSQSMTYFLWRSFYESMKGETKEVRNQARQRLLGTLGMTGVFAGVMGMPLLSMMFGIANAFAAAFGDDDEPWDAEVEFRNFLSDMLGAKLGVIAQEGLVEGGLEALGLKAPEIGSRVSLNDLWIRSADPDVEGRDLYVHLLEQAAGPIAGMLGNGITAASMIGDGLNTGNGQLAWRGVEKAMPKAVRDFMKAARFEAQGVNNMRGDALVPDANVIDSIYQGLGLMPADLSRQYEVNAAAKQYEAYVTGRRQSLLDAYALATRHKDMEAVRETNEKIRAFNQRWPQIAINAATIRRSLQSRERYSERAVNGITLNSRIGDAIRDQVTFDGEGE